MRQSRWPVFGQKARRGALRKAAGMGTCTQIVRFCARIPVTHAKKSAPMVIALGSVRRAWIHLRTRANSAARSPIMSVGALALPLVRQGMIEASATKSPAMP